MAVSPKGQDLDQLQGLDRVTALTASFFRCPAIVSLMCGGTLENVSCSHVLRSKSHHALCLRTMQRGAPLVRAGAPSSPDVRGGREDVPEAFAGVPLLLDGSVVGALCIVDRAPRRFSATDLQFLAQFADIAEEELRSARAIAQMQPAETTPAWMSDGVPLCPGAERAEPAPDEPSAEAADRYRLLLVEDDPSIRLLMEMSLSESYEVAATGDVGEALRRVRGSRFDALVLDINLGQSMDGAGLLREIRAAGLRGVPALACTAYSSGEARQRLLCAGFDHFLAKPFTHEELIAAVTALVTRSDLT